MPNYSKIPRVSVNTGMSFRPAFLPPVFPTVMVDDATITRFGRYKGSGTELLEGGQNIWSDKAQQKVSVSAPLY